MKTQRILLGLGVVEMALHNPVQLAIQTALLDNLSRGRLIVGTGRGSNYNAYEYIGFGTDIVEGRSACRRPRISWSKPGLRRPGVPWHVLAGHRPRGAPATLPAAASALARACLSEESIRAMARLGAPCCYAGAR